MGRRETRENAMKLLYQIQIQKDDIQEQIGRFIEENGIISDSDKEYLLDVVNGVLEKSAELDELISRHAKDWSVQRMPKVDLAIMRLSCYEMKYRDDIPINVSINEAVELAKKYSGDQSKSFVNGVLGKIYTEIKGDHENAPEE
ncbi:MAG TPA: transcription antitermination factor NusB [Clostridiaceae bacterium]|nr:transcription antitermination factor NusB [Clostridiaceae bacterium]